MPETIGHCKHGKFLLYVGCPQCIEEKREAEGKDRHYGLAPEPLSEEARKILTGGRDEMIKAATETAIDTKINLCDTCSLRNDYPVCCPSDIAFGDGKGNDNIIQCSKHIIGEAKPCSIPLNVEITPEPETAIALRPGEDIEVRSYHQESLKILEYAKERVIATAEDNKLATDDLSIISRLKKSMESKRKEYLDPLEGQKVAIRDTYNYLMAPVLEADKITREKMVVYDAEQRRIRAEQEEINRKRLEAAEQEMKLKGEITESVNLMEVAPEPAKTTRTDMGSAGMTDHWKFEVENFALLPDRFKMENATLIGKVVRAGEREIPGVRIWNEPGISVRAR